jgi:hypothetical protein
MEPKNGDTLVKTRANGDHVGLEPSRCLPEDWMLLLYGQKIHKSTIGNVLPFHKYKYKSMKFHASFAQVLDCNDNAHLITIFAPNTEVLVVPQHPCVASIDRVRLFQSESLDVVLFFELFYLFMPSLLFTA